MRPQTADSHMSCVNTGNASRQTAAKASDQLKISRSRASSASAEGRASSRTSRMQASVARPSGAQVLAITASLDGNE